MSLFFPAISPGRCLFQRPGHQVRRHPLPRQLAGRLCGQHRRLHHLGDLETGRSWKNIDTKGAMILVIFATSFHVDECTFRNICEMNIRECELALCSGADLGGPCGFKLL